MAKNKDLFEAILQEREDATQKQKENGMMSEEQNVELKLMSVGDENYFDQLFRGFAKKYDSLIRKAVIACFVMSGFVASEPAFAEQMPNYMLGTGCTCTNPLMISAPCPIHGGLHLD